MSAAEECLSEEFLEETPESKLFDLLRLPPEVVRNILDLVDDKNDLYALLEACPRLHMLVLPAIWQSITFKIRNERKNNLVDTTDVSRLLHARSETINRLHYVKELVVEGTSPPQKWCIHQNRMYKAYFRDIGSDLLLLLGHLEENSLKHFVWNTGTCVPEQMLGIHGYLPAKQRNLESLKLVLNQLCSKNSRLYLATFRKLKHFYLEGAREPEDASTIRDMLKLSRETMVELELNIMPEFLTSIIIHSSRVSNTHWFLFNIIPLAGSNDVPETIGPLFPRLRVLLLSSISFRNYEIKFTQSIDLTSLTSLTIRHCEKWANVFRLLLYKNKQMDFRWLEIEYESASEADVHATVELLKRCPKLEYFSICHGGPMSHPITFKIWEAACAEKLFMRGFVFHMYDFNYATDYFSPVTDGRSSGNEEKLELLLSVSACIAVPQMNPFSDLSLDFLGLCCYPSEILQAILLPFTRKDSLRVLHIRKSAEDMTGVTPFIRALDSFARWAFGEDGIASLECLIFGDFSAKRMRKGINTRYDRTNTSPYFQATVEPEIDDLSYYHRALAMSCPTQFGF